MTHVAAPPVEQVVDQRARVIRRDGTVSAYDRTKISTALSKAFLSVEGSSAAASNRIHDVVGDLTDAVESSLFRHDADRTVHIEDIQDQVELALMRGEHHKVARAYVLYREQHAQARKLTQPAAPALHVVTDAGLQPLDADALQQLIDEACEGLPDALPDRVLEQTRRNLYDGMSLDELALAPVLGARELVETEPDYSQVAARLLLAKLRAEALTHLAGAHRTPTQAEMADAYPGYFADYLRHGIAAELIDPELAHFDIATLGAALLPERDLSFSFLGLQTVYDRYLLHDHGVRFELPQAFLMRVAMGLAIREIDREDKAVEFYRLLSSFDFMCSTPTLFNSGTPRSQLSSCFLTTVADDLDGIFAGIKNNALLSKYAGGLGNDWTPVRGLGAHIKGTNGTSQGVVPFLKIANDTAVAVNQGGKRKGAVCAYLETWHIDIEEFLDLRKNTGDDRRRTHDMNTANWVPDLFIQRVEADGPWTLFSPDEVPELHDLYGTKFATAYEAAERKADAGEIKVIKRVRAVELWRKMLTMLFETGHPWITFKDAANLRSPQQHVGVVHSSNLCTEITLNTNAEEVAVCNLGSVNLAQHVTADGIDHGRLRRTVTTAVRMLDNVIDINFYTIPEARRSNLRHRPVGLGIMGFSDALFTLRTPFSSLAAVEFADTSMEEVSYYAIAASADLARERGAYPTFAGSLWSQGVLPHDSIELLRAARAGDLDADTGATLDWAPLRERVRGGMRNSNVMAIAPTATISNICGVGQSIEPLYRNLFVKSNMSGDFTVVNPHLVRDLKAHGLWDEVMISDLKYYDGNLAQISRIPDDLKELYATAFEIEPHWLVDGAERRQKWIDQAQSLNLYLAAPSGKKLDELYRRAWRKGLKTTYYLRSQSATHVEKSTLRGTDGKLNAVAVAGPSPRADASSVSPATDIAVPPTPPAGNTAVPPASAALEAMVLAPSAFTAEPFSASPAAGPACSIDNPDCEACQ